MGGKTLKNIPLKLYRDFLKDQGCKITRTKGGHEHWTKKDLSRPITVQSHIDPVPEFIIKNGLRILKLTKQDFINWI
ncbi:type II toxin-antitoxin system HicA family toxin [Reichenbachiella sp.]|uniref:type II toxin-antitoxin system HicA family toxin n=1 Tax=Reichenbachiella sp. TaxID=2184521 RepID=UPI003B5A6EEE